MSTIWPINITKQYDTRLAVTRSSKIPLYCCHNNRETKAASLAFHFHRNTKKYPSTHSSLAKNVTRNTPNSFSHKECKFTGQEHIKKSKRSLDSIFFYNLLYAIKCPIFASIFEKIYNF